MTPSSSVIDPPPRWARFLDFLCLFSAIVATVIAVSGGFRIRIFNWRLALTSPLRLWIWALALGVARHVLRPKPSIFRDLPAHLWTALKSPEGRAASSAFWGTRPVILLVGYLAVFTFGYQSGRAPWKIMDNEFVNLQARHDTGWYLNVAIDGYRYDPERLDAQQDVVFFPAYPMLMRAFGRLFGGASTAYLLGGTVISLIAFFWALTYLYRFARDTLGDDDRASTAVWLLAAYPFALFYSAVYSESFYLLTVLAAFYHFRRGEFLRAGAWGLLVGLTRPPGFLLSFCLGLMAFADVMPRWLPVDVGLGVDRVERTRAGLRVRALTAAAMPIAGLLAYSLFLWWLAGHPLAWQEGQYAWGREYTGFSAIVAQRFEWITRDLYSYTAQFPVELLNMVAAIFILASAWPVARRLGLAYAGFMLVNILPPLALGGFMSIGRFSSVLFPAFVWLAGAAAPRLRPTVVASFIAVQALNAALFYTWRPLF